MKKRIISLALALLMALSVFPAAVFADGAVPEEERVTQIRTAFFKEGEQPGDRVPCTQADPGDTVYARVFLTTNYYLGSGILSFYIPNDFFALPPLNNGIAELTPIGNHFNSITCSLRNSSYICDPDFGDKDNMIVAYFGNSSTSPKMFSSEDWVLEFEFTVAESATGSAEMRIPLNQFSYEGVSELVYYPAATGIIALDAESSVDWLTTPETQLATNAAPLKSSKAAITFNANGGQFPTTEETTETVITDLGTVPACSETPEKKGYELSGWATTSDAEEPTGVTAATDNATYYAVWTPEKVNAPSITSSPDSIHLACNYTSGSISVTAVANEDCDITYQWYTVNYEDMPFTFRPVENATSSVYNIPAGLEPGYSENYICRCTATNRYNGVSASADTFPAVVKVNDHDYTVSYDWSNDGQSCTATAVCKTDSNHKITENAKITSAETTPATCGENGVTTYTATFTNSLFGTDTKEIADIPAKQHDYVKTYSWSNDHKTCTATATCKNNAEHTYSETATAVETVAEKPTCVDMGKTKYTAAFNNKSFAAQEVTETNIPATGVHTFVNYTQSSEAHIGQNAKETATCEFCSATDTREIQGSAKPEAVIAIRNIQKYNNKTVEYRATLTFHADVQNAQNVVWHASGATGTTNGDGSFTVKEAKADYSVCFTAVDADGNAVTSETENIKVKHGFFDWLISFFVLLFNKTAYTYNQ